MTRCPSLPSRLRPLSLVAMLAGSLWLSGCASQAERGDGSTPGEAFTELGMAYLEQDNLPRAIAALNRALESDARNPQALQAMAIVYQRQGEDELANETFQKALKADPDYSRARNNYAAFLYDKGRIAEACEQLELASRDTEYANRAQLFANLGQCHWEMGDLAKARSSLERAQSLEPRSPRSYFALAELELTLGNPERAHQQLDAFIRLAGMTPNAQALANEIAVARSGNTAVTPDPDTLSDAP